MDELRISADEYNAILIILLEGAVLRPDLVQKYRDGLEQFHKFFLSSPLGSSFTLSIAKEHEDVT